MKSSFVERCDQAWRDHSPIGLRFSIAALLAGDAELEAGSTRLYVAFDASRDAVKVGTSRRPRLRLANLQVGNPVPLELVVDVAASTGVEQLVHQFLADVRVGGEWFSCSPSTLVVVAVLRGLEDWERTAAGDFDAGFAVDVLRSRASELLEAVSEQAA